MSDRIKIGQVCKAVEITKHELKKWEDNLFLNPPRDKQGHRTYSRDWIRYFQTVKEKIEAGIDFKDIYYSIMSPDRRGPQVSTQTAYGPEY